MPVTDIRKWLEQNELGKYADLLAENEIDLAILPRLSEDDLKELGLPLGARRRLQAAIEQLLETAPEPVSKSTGSRGIHRGEAERRQLTVMFCDLVDSTALSGQMDPEEYREVLAAYQSAVSTPIQRYGGFIARYMGDGLLAYFGYPQAHEDDAERAVRSGLDIVNVVLALKPRGDVQLRVRVGIATGLVVAGDIVGEGTSEERAVLGETPNLAARLQAMAETNTVVLSDSTRRLVEGRIQLEALEPRSLKGIKGTVSAYRAVAVREGSRFDVAQSRGLTKMTGRESELTLLQHRWERARLGEGQTVLLGGEAGIGKSRVTQELREQIRSAVSTVLQYQCSPYHADSAFYPVISQIQHAAKFAVDDTSEVRRKKLDAYIQQALPEVRTAMPLLAALLSLSLDTDPPLEMTPQKQKSETIRVLISLLDHLAARGPVLMIFEDVHWIDPTTREVLDTIIKHIHSLPVLCVVTYRLEFSPPWTRYGHVTTHTLNRLGRDEVSRIVGNLTSGKNLPAEVFEHIVEKTDGVPLFVEELTKTILEEGILEEADGHYVLAGPLHSLSIPATLRDSLLSRLDRHPRIKEVAQTAACIGREFSPDLLAAVSSMEGNVLDGALEQLVDAELVFRRGARELDSYIFKHALVQDVAYESLLVSKRRQVHARIAHVLEDQFAERPEAEPERVAYHYTAAGMAENAIPNWLRAGRRALSSSNLREAISYLSKGLELTREISDLDKQAECELEVRTTLGAATMALDGWPAIEVRDVVRPACDLFEQGCGDSDAFVNFWNLWTHYGCRSEHREGLAVVERMLKYSHEHKDPVLAMVSSFAAAMANFWIGNYDLAMSHENTALDLYEVERDKNLAWSYNHDPKSTLLSWASNRVWALGYPEKACALSDEAVTHAQQVGHPFNLCWTLGNSSFAYTNCGKYDKAHSRIEELSKIAREQDLPFMEAYMVPVSMCALFAGEGDFDAAYREGAQAEEIWSSIGGRFFSPVVKASMALACLNLGRSDEAVGLVGKAIDHIEATDELMYAEEIYRIAGLVQLKHEMDQDVAANFFQKSLDYSKQHGTKSFELRTAMCLAQLWCEQGMRQQACDLLGPIYTWFTEGLDMVDQREAKALLEKAK